MFNTVKNLTVLLVHSLSDAVSISQNIFATETFCQIKTALLKADT